MSKFFRNNRGFTLIELLVVIGIIGILVAGIVALLNPKGQLDKAFDAQRKSDLKQIQNALESYYNDNQAYPIPYPGSHHSCISSPQYSPAWDCWNEAKTDNTTGFIFNPSGTNYIKKMPIDPQYYDTGNACVAARGDTSRLYGYYSADGQSYMLVTSLSILPDASSPNYYNGIVGCTGWANYKIQVP